MLTLLKEDVTFRIKEPDSELFVIRNTNRRHVAITVGRAGSWAVTWEFDLYFDLNKNMLQRFTPVMVF